MLTGVRAVEDLKDARGLAPSSQKRKAAMDGAKITKKMAKDEQDSVSAGDDGDYSMEAESECDSDADDA